MKSCKDKKLIAKNRFTFTFTCFSYGGLYPSASIKLPIAHLDKKIAGEQPEI